MQARYREFRSKMVYVCGIGMGRGRQDVISPSRAEHISARIQGLRRLPVSLLGRYHASSIFLFPYTSSAPRSRSPTFSPLTPVDASVLVLCRAVLRALSLIRMGWNVMPTARNARGIDVVAYDKSEEKFVGIQIKALSRRHPVPLGTSLDKIMGDYWIIVNDLAGEPTAFVMLPHEVKSLAHRGEKDVRVSYWL